MAASELSYARDLSLRVTPRVLVEYPRGSSLIFLARGNLCEYVLLVIIIIHCFLGSRGRVSMLDNVTLHPVIECHCSSVQCSGRLQRDMISNGVES